MKPPAVRRLVQHCVLLALLAVGTPGAAQTPLGTAFTYQGRLNEAGLPATSTYDFDFRLYDAATAGAQVGPVVSRNGVVVTAGLFTVSLDFGTVFTGNARWLEIRVRPAGGSAFQLLAPRQPLTPTPSALFSATVGDLAITAAKLADGSVTSAKIADGTVGLADLGQNGCTTGQVMKWSGSAWACSADVDSGGDITAVNTAAGSGLQGGATTGAASLSLLTSCGPNEILKWNGSSWACAADAVGTSGWDLTGNAGTNPSANFIGTTDNQPLELRVNGQRVLRLEPNPTSPNVVGGFSGNTVGGGEFVGAVIGGGGSSGFANGVTGNFGTVGGGRDNTAAIRGTVGGGESNVASELASVGGGYLNVASGVGASMGAGVGNIASGDFSTVPGGSQNQAGGALSCAAGFRAKVRDPSQSGDSDGDEGTFAWADYDFTDFTSTGPNQFLIRAAGGVGINTNSPAGDLQLGKLADATAFRFGNANARHHLISNRDMVFNTFDQDGSPNGSLLFHWRRNTTKFDENTPINLMTLSDNGNLNVVGSLTKGGGSFKIDHPLDPLNKHLYHSFVESPDMMNVYNGNVITGDDGRATVELPEWFEALNRDFRYQLTVVGGGAWARARVVEKVRENRFVVETDVPGTEVSWQVTGIRQDAWAEAHRIPVEEDKAGAERGRYLHPDVFEGGGAAR